MTTIIPLHILNIIYEYIPLNIKILLNKNNYILNHQKYFINYMNENNYERYIRHILRKDYNFVFYYLLNENYNKWFNIKNYLYKHIIYPHYIMFIEDFTINTQANKCRNIIQQLYINLSLKKNKHKKKIKYFIYGN